MFWHSSDISNCAAFGSSGAVCWHSSDISNCATFGNSGAVFRHSYDIVNCDALFFFAVWLGALKLYCILSSVAVF